MEKKGIGFGGMGWYEIENWIVMIWDGIGWEKMGGYGNKWVGQILVWEEMVINGME